MSRDNVVREAHWSSKLYLAFVFVVFNVLVLYVCNHALSVTRAWSLWPCVGGNMPAQAGLIIIITIFIFICIFYCIFGSWNSKQNKCCVSIFNLFSSYLSDLEDFNADPFPLTELGQGKILARGETSSRFHVLMKIAYFKIILYFIWIYTYTLYSYTIYTVIRFTL